MSLYEWLLFLHVLAAFMLMAGLAAYGVLVLGGGGDATRRALAPPALALWNAGGLGVLVLGVWLAFEVDSYELWDGWILAAIVLWLVASAAGGRLVARRARGRARRARSCCSAVMAAASFVLLVDMIFKPGA